MTCWPPPSIWANSHHRNQLVADIDLQIGQVDQQIGFPLCRFSDSRPEIYPSSSPEHEFTQHLCASTSGKIIDLINIGLADDQARIEL
jgi:hypothetical protein